MAMLFVISVIAVVVGDNVFVVAVVSIAAVAVVAVAVGVVSLLVVVDVPVIAVFVLVVVLMSFGCAWKKFRCLVWFYLHLKKAQTRFWLESSLPEWTKHHLDWRTSLCPKTKQFWFESVCLEGKSTHFYGHFSSLSRAPPPPRQPGNQGALDGGFKLQGFLVWTGPPRFVFFLCFCAAGRSLFFGDFPDIARIFPVCPVPRRSKQEISYLYPYVRPNFPTLTPALPLFFGESRTLLLPYH